MAATDLDGEPLVVHAVRIALLVAGRVVVLAPLGALSALRAGLDRADLGQVLVGSCDPAEDDLASAVARALAGDRMPADVSALLVHDPLCPLAPVEHLADVLAELELPGGGYAAGAAVHPVTDTVKIVHADGEGLAVAGTVDREHLRVVTTPVVIPVDLACGIPAACEGPALVAAMRARGPVRLVASPPVARRVHDRAGLHLVLGLREVEEHRGTR